MTEFRKHTPMYQPYFDEVEALRLNHTVERTADDTYLVDGKFEIYPLKKRICQSGKSKKFKGYKYGSLQSTLAEFISGEKPHKLVYIMKGQTTGRIVTTGPKKLCYAKKNTLLRTEKKNWESGTLMVQKC